MAERNIKLICNFSFPIYFKKLLRVYKRESSVAIIILSLNNTISSIIEYLRIKSWRYIVFIWIKQWKFPSLSHSLSVSLSPISFMVKEKKNNVNVIKCY